MSKRITKINVTSQLNHIFPDEVLQRWGEIIEQEEYEPVDIADIAVDESTTEAKTLNELLPCLNIKIPLTLKEPIKDKLFISFVRLVWEAGTKATADEYGRLLYSIDIKQLSQKLNTTAKKIKELQDNLLVLTNGIIYEDEDNEIFFYCNLFMGEGQIDKRLTYDRKALFKLDFDITEQGGDNT